MKEVKRLMKVYTETMVDFYNIKLDGYWNGWDDMSRAEAAQLENFLQGIEFALACFECTSFLEEMARIRKHTHEVYARATWRGYNSIEGMEVVLDAEA